ncbi:MAG: cysteine desulfurase [Candidatus Aenigmarchaeota archaeon]|nr:cysteine desulfurase [Candidatus Aenigmarchaeota archaeon]
MDVEKIRADIPALQQKFNGKPVIYFDNACMSLRPRQMVEAMDEYYYKYPGCAGRSIHKFGTMVTDKYDAARKRMAKFIGAKDEREIVFTRNTTEGINIVAQSFGLQKGDAVITSDREHNSNLLPWQVLAKRAGIEHSIVYSNESDGTFDLGEFERRVKMLGDRLKLVSVVHTSNLDGYTLPAKEIIDISHSAGALVMLDGAQSVPHKRIDVRKLDADFLAFSGHKMMGPSGIGVLYGKYEQLDKLQPFLVGGDTVQDTTYDTCIFLHPPERFEAGLQNYAGAIGLAAAADYLDGHGFDEAEKHEIELNRVITDGISGIKGLTILGPQDPKLRSGVISFNIEGMFPHDIAIMLDDTANIMIRSGAHCVHSWFNAHVIRGSARASLYMYNTKDEASTFVEKLKEIAKLA